MCSEDPEWLGPLCAQGEDQCLPGCCFRNTQSHGLGSAMWTCSWEGDSPIAVAGAVLLLTPEVLGKIDVVYTVSVV